MNHADHVDLLRQGVPPGGVWADFGAGTGAFTLALAELLGSGAQIYAIDQDEAPLQQLSRTVAARFPATAVQTIVTDFTRPIALPPLDGIVMANALHFIRNKGPVLQLLRRHLVAGDARGRLLLVEYDTDRGNRWVPYPLSFASWQQLAPQHGFARPDLLADRPSRFLGRIYAARTRPAAG